MRPIEISSFHERLSWYCDATQPDKIITISILVTIKFSIEDKRTTFRVTVFAICPGFSSLNYPDFPYGALIRIPQIGSQSASFSFTERSSYFRTEINEVTFFTTHGGVIIYF